MSFFVKKSWGRPKCNIYRYICRSDSINLNYKTCILGLLGISYTENFKAIKTRDYSCNKNSLPDTLQNLSPVQMSYTSFRNTFPENASPASPIVIMHGLLGSKTNWRSLAKVINQRTGRTVYTVDARNHGDSPHTKELDYFVLATDIINFLKESSTSKACLIGHSMGGRAMMTVALQNPDVVEKLFVLDVSPIGTSEGVILIPRLIEAMRRIEIPFDVKLHEARIYADRCLQSVVPVKALRSFLLGNLVKRGENYTWKINLEAIQENFFPNIASFPPANDGKVFNGETYFIGGALSDYIRNDDHDRIRSFFPNARFSYVQGAGHWLHSDNPQDFLKTIIPLIKK